MTVKQNYNVGDVVWIHGISSSNQLTQATVIKCLDLSAEGYNDVHYIVSVPTHIETLLEIRTWHTISQDAIGPVGAFRDLGKNHVADNKKMAHLGYYTVSSSNSYIEEDPSPEQIMAALEKSQQAITHNPLNLNKDLVKNHGPYQKRKYYNRKKKRESN